MIPLRQGTIQTVKYTAELFNGSPFTGVLASGDFFIDKNSAGISTRNSITEGQTSAEQGFWDVELDAIDTNTLGRLDLWARDNPVTPTIKAGIITFEVMTIEKYNRHFGAEGSAVVELTDISNQNVTIQGLISAMSIEVSAIFNKLPGGNISGLDVGTLIDGKSVSYIFELAMCMVNGNYLIDVPSAGKVTFYKRDGVTILTIVTVNTNGRTRDS